jgi:hypothetical protein
LFLDFVELFVSPPVVYSLSVILPSLDYLLFLFLLRVLFN